MAIQFFIHATRVVLVQVPGYLYLHGTSTTRGKFEFIFSYCPCCDSIGGLTRLRLTTTSSNSVRIAIRRQLCNNSIKETTIDTNKKKNIPNMHWQNERYKDKIAESN